MHTRTDAAAKQKVFDLLKEQHIVMLASRDGEGRWHSRPMAATQTDTFTGELWFFTRKDSPKVAELTADGEVMLAYSDPTHQNYVSITGSAEVVHDPAMVAQLWKEPMRTWFPEGKDDPNIALLRVTVDHAEYWDSPSSTMVYAYGYLKAALTGKAPHPGETAKVEFAA